MKKYYRALTIAGSDSGGGAGIQADLKAFSACGCYGMSAITAITVQNTLGVRDIHPVPVPIISGQIRAVLDDIGADAVKIGMLHSPEVIHAVASTLKEYGVKKIVTDPVMVATSGDRLLLEDAVDALVSELIPISTLITPNIPEAEILLKRKIESDADHLDAAKGLGKFGTVVLLKAGHGAGEMLTDILYDPADKSISGYPGRRIDTKNTHGTGCTLSSAIAAYLARGENLGMAVALGKKYISGAIESGADYEIGHGHGPVDHFYQFGEAE